MYKFTEIIADMIQSALSWEQEHGLPYHDHYKDQPPVPLTIITLVDTLNAPENALRGEDDDYQE